MIISRVKAGLFMVSGSVMLVGFDAFLTDETANQITMLGPVQNFLFFVSIALASASISSDRANPVRPVAKQSAGPMLNANIADGILGFPAESENSLIAASAEFMSLASRRGQSLFRGAAL